MKLNLLLLSFVSLLGYGASGCSFGCTLVGCRSGADASVTAVLTGLATKAAGAMPLSIKVCVDTATCATAELTESGGVVSCDIKSGGSFASCFALDSDVQFVVILDEATGGKASVMVSATVTDSASAKVIDASKSAPLQTSAPNGESCGPTCHDGTVSFSS
ncbi:MAG: hypothetical protein ABJE95_34785 [Byssovorax sp.]